DLNASCHDSNCSQDRILVPALRALAIREVPRSLRLNPRSLSWLIGPGARRVSALAELEPVREFTRCAHPPGVGHQLGQALSVHRLQPQHHEWPALVTGRDEETLGLAKQECLLLGLIAHVEHRDVDTDDPRLSRCPLWIGPDESPAADPEVETVAVNFLHLG